MRVLNRKVIFFLVSEIDHWVCCMTKPDFYVPNVAGLRISSTGCIFSRAANLRISLVPLDATLIWSAFPIISRYKKKNLWWIHWIKSKTILLMEYANWPKGDVRSLKTREKTLMISRDAMNLCLLIILENLPQPNYDWWCDNFRFLGPYCIQEQNSCLQRSWLFKKSGSS